MRDVLIITFIVSNFVVSIFIMVINIFVLPVGVILVCITMSLYVLLMLCSPHTSLLRDAMIHLNVRVQISRIRLIK